ncbi:hypothetical protein [Photorhabdus namnaonensis]|uniref:Uncharacterized protein n=1 Tax=Photorhabdus namnaonensis TaxID=1851568 RepID=A0A1B8YIR6_9GAMM|nr:hypothetical protein [Photorhabdus namnaonensis]OCA54986.1 hypothetical protein Phpb_01899 [Photorhabdus namnaonensis]
MPHRASNTLFTGINPILNTQTKHSLKLAHIVDDEDDEDIVLSIQCSLLVEQTQKAMSNKTPVL